MKTGSTPSVIRRSRDEVFRDQGYPVGAARMRVAEPVEPHTHDFLELALVVAGRAEHLTSQGSHPVSKGQVVAVRPGNWHAYTDPIRLEVINIYVGQELLRTDLAWVLDHPRLARLLLHGGQSLEPLSKVDLGEVSGWLDQLAGHRGTDRRLKMILDRSLLSCVLAGLATVTPTTEGPIAEADTAPMTGEVRVVLDLMAADLAADWSVDELARQASVSASHLHRQFRAQVGATPLGWLTRSRAELFAVLLVSTGEAVATIGRQVGWSDPNYASRRFRQAYGTSPSEYRRRFGFAAQD